MHIRAKARHVGRQIAAAFDHDAQAAKTECLDGHGALLDDGGDLANRQDARQDGPLDTEMPGVEPDRILRRCGALHGKVQVQVRPGLGRVVHDADVRENQCVGAYMGGRVDGMLPPREVSGLRIRVDRNEDTHAARMRVLNAVGNLPVLEVQAGEMPGVRVVPEADVDGIGARIYSGFQRLEIPGRTDEFHFCIWVQAKAPNYPAATVSSRYIVSTVFSAGLQDHGRQNANIISKIKNSS